ncbi:hypothetical protein ACFWBN_14215 [Streptomyces sp. NPDC059989]
MNWFDGQAVQAAPAWFHLAVMGGAVVVLVLDVVRGRPHRGGSTRTQAD